MKYVVIDCPDCDGTVPVATTTFPFPACTTCTGLKVVRISEDHLPVYTPASADE